MCHSNVSFAKKCCVLDYFAWQSPGIGRNLCFQMFTGLALFILVFLIEFDVPQKLYRHLFIYQKRKIAKQQDALIRPDEQYDSDVLQENRRIAGLGYNQIKGFNLVLKRITKYYGDFLAVNNLSLAVSG